MAIKLERCSLTDVNETFTIQPYEETQAKAVTEIYHKNTINQVLAEIRNPEPFEWKVHSPNIEFQTVIDKKGRVIGYYSISQTAPSRRNVLEIGVANIEACKIIFNVLLNYAKQRKLAELICQMIPQHPFAQFAYWQNAELRMTMAGGAGMAQILNMKTLFSKMKEEFESRLNQSEFYNKTSSLSVKTAEESMDFQLEHGEILVLTSNEKTEYTLETQLSSLNSLVTGYKSIYELIERKEAIIDSKRGITRKLNGIRLVDVLFPKSTPYGGNLPVFWE